MDDFPWLDDMDIAPAEVLILDFEATCDRSDEQLTRLEQCQRHEIIEFPVVRLAGIPLMEIEVFHEFVQPADGRQISEYCARLTGISREQLAEARPLAQVLDRFMSWLQQRGLDQALLANPPGAVLVTHGEWDLGDQLIIECRRKGIPVPVCLSAFTDLKTVFADAYGCGTAGTSLLRMLDTLELQPVGRLHSGLDDCRNLGLVVEHLALMPAADLSVTHRDGRRERGMEARWDGDWDCPACGAVCFAGKNRCYRCGVSREGEPPPPAEQRCLPCAEPKLEPEKLPAVPAPAAAGGRRAGDWDCPSCGAVVFGSKSSCYKCGTPGGTGATNAAQVRRAGDWDCKSCGALVFASKSHCFQCNAPKPSDSAAVNWQDFTPQQSRRTGDWDCRVCGAMVFASKSHCFQCNAPKPSGSGSGSGSGFSQAESQGRRLGDWDCRVCGAMVFASKNSCYKCGARK